MAQNKVLKPVSLNLNNPKDKWIFDKINDEIPNFSGYVKEKIILDFGDDYDKEFNKEAE